MIRHYFRLAKRGLLKNKYYTVINIFGLVFGMLSALIIAKYIGGSLQFDRFHENKDRIYAVSQEESINGNPREKSTATYWGIGELISRYPEAIHMSRYTYHIESMIMADGDSGNKISYLENKIFSTDTGFLKIFTFPLRYGDRETALSGVNSMVITGPASQRYFGDSNPVGKALSVRVPWGAETTYQITGVIEDLPQRSQFKFDFLTTQAPRDPNGNWLVPDCSTFLLLKDKAKSRELSGKLTVALNEVPPLKSTNRKVWVSLDSLTKVQLSGTQYLLIAVGLFIILISWVNYINQVIAQSYWRMKEIGVLRVLGATRVNLKKQFIVESGLIGLTSLILIVAIYLGIEPSLQSFTNGHSLPLIGDPTPINYIFLAIFTLGISLAAAIPVLILFSPHFGPTIQNAFRSRIGNLGLRQALVIIQFSISTILTICVLVISNQLEFMNNQDKGMNMEEVLIVRAPIVKDTTWAVKRKTVERFKEKCAELPFVIQAASSTTVPSEEYRQETYLSLQGSTAKSMVHQNGVDDQFFDLYAVQFVAGRSFIPDANWKNRSSIILNESAARVLGIFDFDKMINTKIVDHESNEVYDLVGIVKDYHQTSLKYKIRPIAFKFNPFRGHFSLKMNKEGLKGAELEEKLSGIKQIWGQTYPEASFDHFFLDEKFAAQDQEDQYFGKGFSYFTFLSIIISCMGLFGLSLLISSKRQREIGVRKVFGASALDILVFSLKGYLRPLTVAIFIGTPLALLLMNMWLRNFAYKIEIGWGLVTLAWLGLTFIFLFTVSYHTIKSSMANPVAVLRD